jgi:hypothetical protein
MNLLFPLKPRREGAVFDGFISNLATDRFPFEEIGVPTLVINARDDTFAPYRFAAEAAARIPGAKLVSIEAVATGSSDTTPRSEMRSAPSSASSPEQFPSSALPPPTGAGGL